MAILKVSSLWYQALLGTGGIGSGSFFLLEGDHTLGREESRGGRFLDRRDYCKLHIVSHYVKALLGESFAVLPVGRVGDDESGRQLLREMAEVGLDLRYVETLPGRKSLYSFCFLYPDGSGGNLTTDDSACSAVDAAYVDRAALAFAAYRGRGIALAVPEVPLEARIRLLELGTKHDFFRAASFTLGEIPRVRESALLENVDLLALNLEEAQAAAGSRGGGRAARDPVPAGGAEGAAAAAARRAIAALAARYPSLKLSVTAGASGSWSWDGEAVQYCPALPVKVETTGGAGDAHLSGILAGLAAGLTMAEAHQLGVLLAAASVISPHTINKGTTRGMLLDLAISAGACNNLLIFLLE